MARARRSGRMEANMTVSGQKIKPMDRANLCMQMATSTKANGSMTRPRVRAPTSMPTEPSTRANGSMTNSTATASNLGLMARSMKAAMKTARKRVKES